MSRKPRLAGPEDREQISKNELLTAN
jgi:hypothetical protein